MYPPMEVGAVRPTREGVATIGDDVHWEVVASASGVAAQSCAAALDNALDHTCPEPTYGSGSRLEHRV